MSGPHYISVPKRRVIGHAATDYLSPDAVGEFRTAILDTGLGLGTLLTAEYPSWASGAQNEFLATSEV